MQCAAEHHWKHTALCWWAAVKLPLLQTQVLLRMFIKFGFIYLFGAI